MKKRKEKGRRKPRRPISDEEKIQLALRKYSYDFERGFPTLEEMAKSEGRAAATIQKAIYYAFQHELVEIRRTSIEPLDYKDEASLQQQLRDIYPDTTIRVITPLGHAIGSNDVSRHSDYVHRAIGKAFAVDQSTTGKRRRDATVALGGGRAVYHFVEELRGLSPLRWKNTQLVSLSGNIHARDHAKEIRGHLDADKNVETLAWSLPTDEQLPPKLVSSPIVHDDENATRIVRRTSPIGMKNWESFTPDFAIVGVGVLLGGHRFAAIGENPGVLTPISKELRKLAALCNTHSSARSGYCPVMDCGNRLLFVPPRDQQMPKSTENKILRSIKAVNDRLINVTLTQLAKVEEIAIIAGTAPKAQAILELLDNRALRAKRLNIETIYTDSECAREMLRVHQSPKR